MAITPLPALDRASPTFKTEVDDFFANKLPTFSVEANAAAIAMTLNATTDTSASSNAIGVGAKTFIVSAGKSFLPGMYLVIADTAAPSTNSMAGQITSYSGTTLVMNITSITGSGTKTAWTISQSTPVGTENTSNKDSSGGYPGLTALKLNLKNAANTFTNFMTNATTAVRTWTFPDKNGVVALTNDLIGVEQTYQNFGGGTRVLGTTYTNTTGKPIFVVVSMTNSVNNSIITAAIAGLNMPGMSMLTSSGAYYVASFIIPDGASYVITMNGTPTLAQWVELR